MAITKDRLLALVNAARDFRSALVLAQKLVAQEYAKVTAGRSDPTTSLSNLEVLINAQTLPTNYALSDKTIDLEWKDLRANWGRNERAAARKRRQAGYDPAPRTKIIARGDRLEIVPHRSTAPKSLVPEDRLVTKADALLLGQDEVDTDETPMPGLEPEKKAELDAEVEQLLKQGLDE